MLRIINQQRKKQNIYNDNQSVHNHNIQVCLHNNINYLLKDKPDIDNHTLLKEIEHECVCYELLNEYISMKDVHSILNVTFEEILMAVWNKIRIHKDKNEIIKILNIEMLDSECKCFTGRITRLVNCLNGFDSNIKIEISENEQMSYIAGITYEKYPQRDDYERELRKEFQERRYSEQDLNDWLNL